MKKSKQLNSWLWKWHILSGLICAPVIALLCITGSIYLFKSNYNDYAYQDARFVSAPIGAVKRSYAEQLAAAQAHSDSHIMNMTLASAANTSTAFREHAAAHARNLVYVDPYTAQVTGTYQQQESLMYTVRKLHGELLLGLPGTLAVELVASWFIVLALTGIYVWWPQTKFSLGGFFTVRANKTRRVFWRDMHSVVSFWMSAFMLIILAGGMPWTEIFGDNLKWVQTQTNTGYPEHWRNSKGLSSKSTEEAQQAISIDHVVAIGLQQNMPGVLTIKIPMRSNGVYSIANKSLWLDDQRVIHINQYSGEIIKALEWRQVGILMTLRQVFMRLHQGEYGLPSLIAVLLVSMTFFIATMASLVSYLIRKPSGNWGLPKVPDNFNAGLAVVFIMMALGLIFPAFGASVLLILALDYIAASIRKWRMPNLANSN